MEIKYDNSGQPLPESQQDWAKEEKAAKQVAQKELKPVEPTENDEINIGGGANEDNPFVQAYLREQKELKTSQEQETPEIVQPLAEDLSILAPEPEEVIEAAPTKQDHPNFRALREKAEQAERQRDELLKMLRDRDQQQPRTQNVSPDLDNDFDLPEDGYVEPRHIKKIAQEARAVRKELAEYKQKTARELQEMMLYKNHPDIEKVVSPENIQILKELKPHYVRQLAELHAQDRIFEAGDLAYNYMVDLGIYKTSKPAPVKDYLADKARAHANSLKPKPLVSGTIKSGDNPLARASAFSAELDDASMKQHYADLLAASKNRYD